VYADARDGRADPAVAHAAVRAAALAAAAAGVAWGLACAAVARRGPSLRWLKPATVGVLAAIAVVALAGGLAERERIGDGLSRQYDAFTHVGDTPAASGSSTRLASGSGNRYDYWRIAVHAWRDRPLLGVGAGNYDEVYFRERATTEDVRQPHSIELQALSELGLAGAALLALVLAWGARGLAAAARRSPAARFQAVAAVGCATAWLAHTSVDWLHLLPGLTGMALAAGVVLVRVRDPLPAAAAVRPATRQGLALAVAVSIALAAAGLGLSRQWLAERFERQAQSALAARPADALRLADRSLRLDREAVGAYYVKSAAFARFGEARAARAALEEAARREPGDFVTWALLGDLAMRTGDRAQARRDYGRALELNPRDPGLRRQLEAARG
jgi:tetratricopeptide (TPR) repeat protein